jgi:signal transduction histidine kinase
MPKGGKLCVRVRAATDWRTSAQGVRITVADTGQGMTQETRRRLFEPFYTTKGPTGTGLGLWITSEIIAKYKGRIEVRSSRVPGRQGTVFAVFLPQ